MTENIVELLTDVADAIREKKGSNEPINAQAFAEEIKNLPSGGGDNDGIPSAVKDNNGNGVTNITTLSFNASVVEVAHYAYYGCRNLKEVSFNNVLSYIGMGAFYECPIETLNLPSTINFLGKQCFAKMAALKTFTIPIDAPIQVLPNNMLWNSPLLTKFTVPKNVNKVDGFAFEGCSGLEYIDFSNLLSIPTLPNTTPFNGVTKAKFVVPDSLYDEWIAATNWATFADRIVKDSEYTKPL